MAIKVNGQVVIDDSRQLTNIASVDAASVAALGAAGVGGDPNYVVDVPDFNSPNLTLTGSGTYSRGSTPADQLLWIYMVGGGAGHGTGGSYNTGAANGGKFAFVICKASTLDGSSYSVGVGGTGGATVDGSNDTPTTFTIDGTVYSTDTTQTYKVIDGALPTGVTSTYIDNIIYTPSVTTNYDYGYGSNYGTVFAGNSSWEVYYDGSAQDSGLPRESLFAGDSGKSMSSPTAGQVPGGGGGGNWGGPFMNGGNGNIRIYHV